MIYYVQRGDTLAIIARRFNTTVNALLEANVICNPNLIFIGQPLIIPRPGVDLPKAGGTPYYIVLPRDTLWCLAKQFNSTIPVLAAINQIANPNLIYPGTELLIGPDIPNPEELAESWRRAAAEFCETPSSLQIHGIYYIGSYQWQALGRRAIPYLLNFLTNPCDLARYYAVLSLGRLGQNNEVKTALTAKFNDPDRAVANLAHLAVRRINLVQQGKERVHITLSELPLHTEPNLNSSSITLPEGAEVIVMKWFIPSPTAEEGPTGGVQIFDLVQVVNTGRTGYLPRVGYNETRLM